MSSNDCESNNLGVTKNQEKLNLDNNIAEIRHHATKMAMTQMIVYLAIYTAIFLVSWGIVLLFKAIL